MAYSCIAVGLGWDSGFAFAITTTAADAMAVVERACNCHHYFPYIAEYR
jgi:hypothetical protein